MSKTVLVTGANTGIGYALCKLLATEHGCSVLLGSRTKSKGEKAVADIKKLAPNASVELVEIDVSSDESVAAAAAAVKAKGVTLYGLVNNAGVGLNTNGDIIETNFKGPIRVSEAFLELIEDKGRIVNVSLGRRVELGAPAGRGYQKVLLGPGHLEGGARRGRREAGRRRRGRLARHVRALEGRADGLHALSGEGVSAPDVRVRGQRLWGAVASMA